MPFVAEFVRDLFAEKGALSHAFHHQVSEKIAQKVGRMDLATGQQRAKLTASFHGEGHAPRHRFAPQLSIC